MSYSPFAQAIGIISLAEVRRHLDRADLKKRWAILDFVKKNPKRIRPLPDDAWMCDKLIDCFLECITHKETECGDDTPPESDDSFLTPFEAAEALVGLFVWILQQRPEGRQRAALIVSRITSQFRAATAQQQNIIETGFLEHVLEFPEARPLFRSWSRDPDLQDSFQAALSWGVAHTRNGEA